MTDATTADLEAERDRLRRVVDAVRDAFVRHNDERWCIAPGALVELADALDNLDAVEADRKPPRSRFALEIELMELSDLLGQVAFAVVPRDEPIELIEITDTPELVRQLVHDRDRLRRAVEQAVEDLNGALMPSPAILVGMSSYLRAALRGPA
jgi:hypothetical protein